MKKGSNSDDRI